MDLDIFMRKAEVKGYCFPKLDSGKVIYKMETLAGNDYTIESTPLERTPVCIVVTRFSKIKSENNWREEMVADIFCRSLDETEKAITQIQKLEEGSPSHPFDLLLSQSGLTILLKKKGWSLK